MSFFKNQFANVIEWNESREGEIFWLWNNREIKKDSRLIVRPGQEAIFLYQGKIEGIFTEPGNYEIDSEIIPFLTTLSSFKFGFNTPLRAEVLFVNRKEFLVKWGTKNTLLLPAPGLKGGLPIRCFGTFNVSVCDYHVLIQKIAGIKESFTVDDVKERVIAQLDPLLMRWISTEGKDMFNLQINAYQIAQGIEGDLRKELNEIGFEVTDFTISNFNYPEEVQKMIEKTASHSMVGDLGTYQQISLIDSLSTNPNGGMASMMQTGAGMAMGLHMMNQMNAAMASNTTHHTQPTHGSCSTCHHPLPQGAKFCSNCGSQVIPQEPNKFCASCGAKVTAGAKFCNECGGHLNQ